MSPSLLPSPLFTSTSSHLLGVPVASLLSQSHALLPHLFDFSFFFLSFRYSFPPLPSLLSMKRTKTSSIIRPTRHQDHGLFYSGLHRWSIAPRAMGQSREKM
ncbi:hypothetical protein BOTBODRAFT_432453 [Botryobasidium botryosum FD-172 SS1]|uniref:Uncharacterized protein n=1 Tax=Botryobasidium botryosum (strain FD-172 SS1) TaxID=930990 RepID=A0A067MK52_BOTB1|nr:hypothetical protein BOTBODRAFT_432453 [Botryobasidium botryosum FD-172 SS1]